MMPESYAELIPAVPEPVYKYISEGASEYAETLGIVKMNALALSARFLWLAIGYGNLWLHTEHLPFCFKMSFFNWKWRFTD